MSDKILYIGTFDSTGYGQASVETAIAMDTIGLDVVCRQVNLNNKPVSNHPTIQKLFNKSSDNANICIQHVLPNLFDYNGYFDKNILFFALETNQINYLWKKYLNCPDNIWVINKHAARVVKQATHKAKIHVIPHPIDLNKFTKSPTNTGLVAKLKQEFGYYVFYTIGEFVSRKDYETLLKAYLSEFTAEDNTCLLIKTSRDGKSPAESMDSVVALINHVKRNLKLSNYPQIQVCTDFLSAQQLEQIHMESDCFVQTSHGEAWSLPATDAIGFKRTPILPAHTGYLDYAQKNNSFAVESHEVPCYGCLDVEYPLYNSRQTWYQVDLIKLKETMRLVYNQRNNRIIREKQAHSLSSLEHFTYHKVGNIIKKALNAT